MAVKTVVASGTTLLWSSASSWSPSGVPLATDDVVFTSSSGNINVDTNAAVCKSIDLTNYTGNIGFNAQLTISGNVTLVNTCTTSGSGNLTINANSTITSNGVTWARTINFGAGITVTLSGNFTVSSTLTTGAGAIIVNGSNLLVSGITLGYNTGNNLSGTSTIIIKGGTITGTGGLTYITNNLTIDSGANTVTFSLAWGYSTGTFTYTSGTVVMGTNMVFYVGNGTYNTGSSIVFKQPTFASGTTSTLTLNGDFYWTGTLFVNDVAITVSGTGRFVSGSSANIQIGTTTGTTISTSQFASTLNLVNFTTITTGAATNTVNGITLNVSGNASIGSNGGNLAGTASLNMTGTGTLGGTTTLIKIPVTINTSGTITIGTNLYFGTGGSFTYTPQVGSSVVVTTNLLTFIGNVTMNSGAIIWNNINATSAGTITLNSNLLWSGSLSYNPSAAISGTGRLTPSGGSTTLNISTGVYDTSQFPSSFSINTLNIAANGACSLNTFNMSVTGSATLTGNTVINGTGTLTMAGTGSITVTSTSYFACNLTIDTLGTITIPSAVTFNYGGSSSGTLSYVKGTVVTTGSTLQIPYSVSAQTVTLNTGSLIWNNVTFGSSGALITCTLSSNLTWSGTLTMQNQMSFSGAGKLTPSNNTTTTLVFGGQSGSYDYSAVFPTTLNIKNLTISPGSFTVTFNSVTTNINGSLVHINGVITGTSVLNLVGTGSWAGAYNQLTYVQNNITINTSGKITLGTTIGYNSGTITYTSGTVETTGNTLYMFLTGTTTTLNTGSGSGITWNNVQINNSIMTFVLNSTFTVGGTVYSVQNGTFTFSGSAGFVFNNFTQQYSSGFSMTLKAGNTYQINGGFYWATGNSTHGIVKSDTTSSAAKLIFGYGAACNISYMDFTDIDASGGRTINIFNGVAPVRCTNVRTYTDLPTIGS